MRLVNAPDFVAQYSYQISRQFVFQMKSNYFPV